MTDSTILQPEGLEQRYERYKEKIKDKDEFVEKVKELYVSWE